MDASALIRLAAGSTVASLFASQASLRPDAPAIEDGARRITYGVLAERVRRLAGLLAACSVGIGDRIAILAENRAEYLEVFLAGARLGAIVACQNWRLAAPELAHGLALVEPTAVFVSPRHADRLAALDRPNPPAIVFGDGYEALLTNAGSPPESEVDPEDPLLILYTSGTTGLPKGAVISHRAEIVRNLVTRAEYGIGERDTFVAWSPLYHMGAVDFALGALMTGGKVVVVDGFDAPRLAELVATEEIGWLPLMPGMVGEFAAVLRQQSIRPKGVRLCGAMPDLVPRAMIAEITRLLNAPFANTFGATETGFPPCSSNCIPIGEAPARLSKQQSPYCEIRLVDALDRDVADGAPGELCLRGPTLFSGYFRADATNAQDFRGGWFHMGDMFVRNPDGTLDFVDRVKYLIKSGGENIYPAEIERVLLSDPRVADAAVVRRPDAKWGEVPVAFVARRDEALTVTELAALCRSALAGYKQPKAIRFIALEEFPRSASGKIQRLALEQRLDAEDAANRRTAPP